jgi:hypothetical protein
MGLHPISRTSSPLRCVVHVVVDVVVGVDAVQDVDAVSLSVSAGTDISSHGGEGWGLRHGSRHKGTAQHITYGKKGASLSVL